MASRSSPYLLLLLCKHIIVSATTIFHLYTDASCKTLYATVQTDTSAGNGQCGEFTTSLNSASSAFVDDGCSVTTYTGLGDQSWCDNNATLVPTGSCTTMSIGSFSVDCPQVNGTEAAYTTILASSKSSPTSLPSTTSTSASSVSVPTVSTSASSVSVPPVPTSTSSLTIPPASISQQHSTSSVRPSTPLSSTVPSLPGTPPSLLQEIRPSPSSTSQPSPLPSTSPSPSPLSSSSSSTSPTQKGDSGNDGGLSGPSTIAIGVVLPGVAVLVAIVFGVKKWKNS